MNILMTTFGLLLVFVLFCTAQWRAATDMIFMDIVAIEAFANSRNSALDLVENTSKEIYEELSPKAPPTQSKAIAAKIDSTKAAETQALLETEEEDDGAVKIDKRKKKKEDKKKQQQPTQKCTSLLHIGAILSDESVNVNSDKGKAIFELMKNLVNVMYKDEKFFIRAQENDPEFTQQFLLNLFDKSKEVQKERNLEIPKDLTTVELDDAKQSYIRYKMFKGTKTRLSKAKQHRNQAGYYPLLEFISLDKRSGDTIMSVWLAERPLLMALFRDEKIVDEVIECRRETFNDIRKRKTAGMSGIDATNSRELELRFGALIPDNLRKYIDLSISQTAPPRDY